MLLILLKSGMRSVMVKNRHRAGDRARFMETPTMSRGRRKPFCVIFRPLRLPFSRRAVDAIWTNTI
jgi:hypothetical protein